MPQYAIPNSDVDLGTWSAGYANIDDPPGAPDDSDQSVQNNADDETPLPLKVGLSAVTDPGPEPGFSLGHIIHWRAKAGISSINPVEKLKLSLYEVLLGTPVLRATSGFVTLTPRGGFNDYSYTLDPTEADAITDYSALQLWIESTGVDRDGGGILDIVSLSQAYLEVPPPLEPGSLASLGVGK